PAGITWTSGVDASAWSGHLDVFGAGSDGNVWHRAGDSTSGFGVWESLGMPVSVNPETKFRTPWPVSSSPGAVSFSANHIDLFAQGGGGLYQDTFNGSTWTGWFSIGSSSSVVDAASRGSGLLDAFGVDSDGMIMHVAHSTGARHPAE